MTPSPAREKLVTEIIEIIINALNLHHFDQAAINSETALTHGGLGLDSVDILEIIVTIEQRYGVKVRDAETGNKYFRTIGTIADFVETKPT